MTLEQALRSFLLADATLSTLVGQRVYPDVVPQGVATRPAIVYRQLGADTQSFISGGQSACRRDMYELETLSPRRSECAVVRDRLRDLFAGTACAGVWGGEGGILVAGGVFEDADADEEPLGNGSEDINRSLRATVTIVYNRG